MSTPHSWLIATAIVTLIFPAAIWVTRTLSRYLARHDAGAKQDELDQIVDSIGHADDDADQVALIAELAEEEIALIREMLGIRFAGDHVSKEQTAELRRVHRRGLGARQRCGDPLLDAELSWLQGFGSFVSMADLSELDAAHFERELAYRSAEVRGALALRRMRNETVQAGMLGSATSFRAAPGENPRDA